MTTSTRHARAITQTAETEQEDHMSDISDESDLQTMGYVHFLNRHLEPAFAKLRSFGIFAHTCPTKVMSTPEEGRAFCEANTHKTSYLFFTREDVDDFEKNQCIWLRYHTTTGLEMNLILVVLQWYIPKVYTTVVFSSNQTRVSYVSYPPEHVASPTIIHLY